MKYLLVVMLLVGCYKQYRAETKVRPSLVSNEPRLATYIWNDNKIVEAIYSDTFNDSVVKAHVEWGKERVKQLNRYDSIIKANE
jgi:hypothetical protein